MCPGVFSVMKNPVFAADFETKLTLVEHAARIAASLDDQMLAAQVLLAGIEGKGSLSPAMRNLLDKIPAGGIMLFKYNLDTSKDEVKKLLSETSGLVTGRAGISPFMAVDHEGGLVHRFGPGVERLPSALSFWETALREGFVAAIAGAKTLYRRSAVEIRELGINMVLGPVVEILNEDNLAFLDTRSYGSDWAFTQIAASAFISSMEEAGIACAVKHFPGNTAADPHSGASVLEADRNTLDEMVRPFTGIFHSLNPQAVMISHVMVPDLDSEKNASLSRAVIEDWLRGELGFKGIVIADDFSMAAVAGSGLDHTEAAVEALNAGVDMIMTWPKDLAAVHTAIMDALKTGKLSRQRLLEAAGRIISGKLRFRIIEYDLQR